MEIFVVVYLLGGILQCIEDYGGHPVYAVVH